MPALTSLLIAGTVAAVAGTGVQMYAAHEQADAQKQEIAAQQQIEAQRRQAMELDARRKQLEIVRQSQRTRALATATASSQGALFGSGIQGGYGQISGETGTNMLGVQQNLQIGENIFGLNQQVSAARMQMADAGSLSAMGSGISSLGNALIKNAGTVGNIFAPTPNLGGGYNTYGGFVRGIGSNGIY